MIVVLSMLSFKPAFSLSSFTLQAQLVAQRLKHLPAMWETWVRPLGWENPLEKEMAIHFSTLTWKILWADRFGCNLVTKQQQSSSLHLWRILLEIEI